MGVEPPVLPTLDLPVAPNIPRVTLDIPKADIPSYRPIVVPPSSLSRDEGVAATDDDEEAATSQAMQRVDIPFTNISMPFPQEEILVTAATTAAVSVAATLTATAIFKRVVQVFKPVIMQAVKRIQKKLNGGEKEGATQ